jgi:hypothetical protein
VSGFTRPITFDRRGVRAPLRGMGGFARACRRTGVLAMPA